MNTRFWRNSATIAVASLFFVLIYIGSGEPFIPPASDATLSEQSVCVKTKALAWLNKGAYIQKQDLNRMHRECTEEEMLARVSESKPEIVAHQLQVLMAK